MYQTSDKVVDLAYSKMISTPYVLLIGDKK